MIAALLYDIIVRQGFFCALVMIHTDYSRSEMTYSYRESRNTVMIYWNLMRKNGGSYYVAAFCHRPRWKREEQSDFT